MKWSKTLFFTALFAVATVCAQNDPEPSAQQRFHFEKQVTKTLEANYLLFLPEGYEAAGDKK